MYQQIVWQAEQVDLVDCPRFLCNLPNRIDLNSGKEKILDKTAYSQIEILGYLNYTITH